MKYTLPGTPRDLLSIEAHMERSERNSVFLYTYETMKLINSGHAGIYTSASLLAEIRHDLCATRSALYAIKKLNEDRQTVRLSFNRVITTNPSEQASGLYLRISD